MPPGCEQELSEQLHGSVARVSEDAQVGRLELVIGVEEDVHTRPPHTALVQQGLRKLSGGPGGPDVAE
jgi:hypothetical protein